MQFIESFSYRSIFRYVHPNIKLFSSLIVIFTVVFCYDLKVSMLALIVTGALAIVALKIPFNHYVKLMLIPISFIMLSAITILIEIGTPPNGGVLIKLFNIFFISKIGLIRGITVVVTALSATNIMYLFALTTPIIDLCSGLKALKIPESIISLMLMMYRLIFVIFTMGQTMRIAQTSRLGYKNFPVAIKSFAMLLSGLFIRSFKKTYRMYDALESRGYQGRFTVIDLKYQLDYYIVLLSIVFSIILISIMRL